jgi:hypothetical protein
VDQIIEEIKLIISDYSILLPISHFSIRGNTKVIEPRKILLLYQTPSPLHPPPSLLYSPALLSLSLSHNLSLTKPPTKQPPQLQTSLAQYQTDKPFLWCYTSIPAAKTGLGRWVSERGPEEECLLFLYRCYSIRRRKLVCVDGGVLRMTVKFK